MQENCCRSQFRTTIGKFPVNTRQYRFSEEIRVVSLPHRKEFNGNKTTAQEINRNSIVQKGDRPSDRRGGGSLWATISLRRRKGRQNDPPDLPLNFSCPLLCDEAIFAFVLTRRCAGFSEGRGGMARSDLSPIDLRSLGSCTAKLRRTILSFGQLLFRFRDRHRPAASAQALVEHDRTENLNIC
jgi:hypothetical protein